jgi:hypothetical protein
LNSGFLLGVVIAQLLPSLSISPPWRVDETDVGFMIRDRDGGALACVGFERPTADSLLTRDEARDIAVSITRLPGRRSAPLKLKPPVVASA